MKKRREDEYLGPSRGWAKIMHKQQCLFCGRYCRRYGFADFVYYLYGSDVYGRKTGGGAFMVLE